ncbi:hypothetical protein WA158_008053 [Blastocystis sp. Blastoise]
MISMSSRNLSTAHAINMIKKSRAIVFDIDHTVASFDGVQTLAKMTNKLNEVYTLMMDIVVKRNVLEDYLIQSLDVIKPNHDLIEKYINETPVDLAPGVEDLISKLRKMNKDIYLVSGGFKQLQTPISAKLNVADDFLFDNIMQFDEKGNYKNLDLTQPTMNIKGKARVVEIIKSRYPKDDNIVVNFGDGILDSEACPPSDCFIRYTKFNNRPLPKDNSTISIDDFNEIIKLLD